MRVLYSAQALKALRRMDAQARSRTRVHIRRLQSAPFPSGAKRVEGSTLKVYRIRIGRFRVLYEVDHTNETIGIIKIDKRARVYK